MNNPRIVILGSVIVAGLVAVLCVLDMAIGVPFARQTTMDVLFLIGSALVIYMGIDSFRELR